MIAKISGCLILFYFRNLFNHNFKMGNLNFQKNIMRFLEMFFSVIDVFIKKKFIDKLYEIIFVFIQNFKMFYEFI